MQPAPDFIPAAAAKKLLRESRSGALATLMPGSGGPYCLIGQCRERSRRRAAVADLDPGRAHQEHSRRCPGVAHARRAPGRRSARRGARHADGHGGADRGPQRPAALSGAPARGRNVCRVRRFRNGRKIGILGRNCVRGSGWLGVNCCSAAWNRRGLGALLLGTRRSAQLILVNAA